MEVLVNTEYDDVTINSADSKKYDSFIYRYRITINSNLSTYGEGLEKYTTDKQNGFSLTYLLIISFAFSLVTSSLSSYNPTI